MKALFTSIRSDLATHSGDWGRQGFWALLVYRFGQWRYSLRFPLVRKVFSLIYKFLFKICQVVTGIELPCEAEIGLRFRIDHFGGIIISGDAHFGDDCVIRQGVTVGLRHVEDPRSPIIGDRVDIGAGAKVLGNIRIGSDVSIGANAVVLCDVPDHCIAVGVPARIIPNKNNNITSLAS